jgi:acyl dehydratase
MHEATTDAMRGHAGTTSYPLNYGFDRIRFVAPVVVGSRIRAHFLLKERTRRPEGDLLRVEVTVEIEGQDRPALIAEWLTMWVTKTTKAGTL